MTTEFTEMEKATRAHFLTVIAALLNAGIERFEATTARYGSTRIMFYGDDDVRPAGIALLKAGFGELNVKFTENGMYGIFEIQPPAVEETENFGNVKTDLN